MLMLKNNDDLNISAHCNANLERYTKQKVKANKKMYQIIKLENRLEKVIHLIKKELDIVYKKKESK